MVVLGLMYQALGSALLLISEWPNDVEDHPKMIFEELCIEIGIWR